MRIPKELKSDEEFEQWVTVYALWEAEDPFVYTFKGKIRLKEDEIKRFIMDTASYERAMWYYKKRFNTWDKEALQPLVDELVSVQHHRQADGQNRFATM